MSAKQVLDELIRLSLDVGREDRALAILGEGNTSANAGDGTFNDVSEPAGVTMGRWAWGSRFADLNNDGWEDLVVANGYITQPDAGDL